LRISVQKLNKSKTNQSTIVDSEIESLPNMLQDWKADRLCASKRNKYSCMSDAFWSSLAVSDKVYSCTNYILSKSPYTPRIYEGQGREGRKFVSNGKHRSFQTFGWTKVRRLSLTKFSAFSWGRTDFPRIWEGPDTSPTSRCQ
jgi:hypothetical protein